MNSQAKTILGIMAVGAVGVAIGVLLAPQKGSETRSSLSEKADDIQDTLSDLIDSGKEFIKSSLEKFADAKNDVATRANDLKIEAKSDLNKVRSSIS